MGDLFKKAAYARHGGEVLSCALQKVLGPVAAVTLIALPLQVRKHSAVHEGLSWELCCMLAQQCSAGSLVILPKQARSAILEALQVCLVLCGDLNYAGTHYTAYLS